MHHSSRLWSSSGASKIHTLSFLPNISVPSTLLFLPLYLFYLTFAQLLYFAIQEKGRRKWSSLDTIIPPMNHFVETPQCSKCNSWFFMFASQVQLSVSLSMFLIQFYCVPLLPVCLHTLFTGLIFSLAGAFEYIYAYTIHTLYITYKQQPYSKP